MHITYVTETYPPEINGVALTVARTVQHLRAAGHTVQLLRPRQHSELPQHDTDEWRTSGLPIPMYPALRFGWISGAALRHHWRSAPTDLVHAATPGPLGWAALRAARAAGVATTADFRTNFHAYCHHYRLGLLAPALLAHLRRLHALADANFVPTPALARSLQARGFARLQVVGRGVDSRRFDPQHRCAALRASWGVQDDTTPVLLHVGRLAPEKNVALVLRTWHALRAQRPGLRLVVVGDGPLRAQLQASHPQANQQANDPQAAQPQVVFTGMLQGEALARAYASADLFLFPSLTDTFGNVLLEALASGLAVVAFDMAAAALHVQHGRNGWLAAPGDAVCFIDAAWQALQSLTHPQRAAAQALRAQARQAALAVDWDDQLAVFERQLRAVLADRQATGVAHAALA